MFYFLFYFFVWLDNLDKLYLNYLYNMNHILVIRLIIFVLISVALFYYIYLDKDPSTMDYVIDVELFITLILALLYAFTYDNSFWYNYYWIWRVVILLTMLIYIVRLIVTRPIGWENRATTAFIVVLILAMRLGFRAVR